jgi:4-amino-4-deoxy-L-arabinose transferase-like glycosyltransferase
MKNFLQDFLGPNWLLLTFTALFATTFGGLLLYLCAVLPTSQQGAAVNLLIALLGTLAGWAIGMFFSPFDEKDAKRFEFLGKSVAAFLSGYALSKLDPLIFAQIERATKKPEEIAWPQVGIAIAGFLLGAVVVFVNRAYRSA